MHQTKMTILLSLNAVVILIVGVMIFSAINLNGGIEFQVVSERSDVIAENLAEAELLAPGLVEQDAIVIVDSAKTETSEGDTGDVSTTQVSNSGVQPVPAGQLWNETSTTIYQTADRDICVGGGLTNIGDMYWQTSNTAVIRGFAASRTMLGYDGSVCRTPVIVGTGTVTITAGTYDGRRRDEITVTVIAPPVEQWKRDVLGLVNQERAKAGVGALVWGSTCAAAANIRASEIMKVYAHQRPDGSDWSTACPIPASGGRSGENLNAGGLAVSPETTVLGWMNSPEHKKNILDPNFKYLSVGFVFDPNSPYKTYWSQIFSTY